MSSLDHIDLAHRWSKGVWVTPVLNALEWLGPEARDDDLGYWYDQLLAALRSPDLDPADRKNAEELLASGKFAWLRRKGKVWDRLRRVIPGLVLVLLVVFPGLLQAGTMPLAAEGGTMPVFVEAATMPASVASASMPPFVDGATAPLVSNLGTMPAPSIMAVTCTPRTSTRSPAGRAPSGTPQSSRSARANSATRLAPPPPSFFRP